MHAENLMRALNDVDDKYIEESSTETVCCSGGFTHTKTSRVTLIAAVIASLMAAAAYATGWFGLSSRVEESQLPGIPQLPSTEETPDDRIPVSGKWL